ncbi:MAG: hypothetical protein ACFFCW_27750 [Candidatus Hodarchaeota archaeon]
MRDIKPILKAMKQSLDAKERDYNEYWKEAGLKSVFIVPLFERVLGYDPLIDMAFEFKLPATGGEYLDILLQDSLVIETKRFNLLSDDKQRKKAHKEIRRYLSPDDSISFGILTDGVIWDFFMEKRFLERYGNNTEKVPPIREDIPLCFSLNSFDDGFLDDMSIFHAKGFYRNMKYLAACIVHRALRKPGAKAWYKLFSALENAQRQKICGDKIAVKIEDRFRSETGEFKDDPSMIGKTLQWEDEFLRLSVIVQPRGKIKVDLSNSNTILKPERQQGVLEKYPNITDRVFKTWPTSEQDRIYNSRVELLREITGKTKIYKQKEFLDGWTESVQ